MLDALLHKYAHMIEYIELHNWKSFAEAKLYIEPLTFIIGTNASGKSNILDSLFFLSRLAAGYSVDDCARRIRGGEEWICRMGTTSFTLKAKVHNDDTDTDYYYEVEVTRNDGKFEIKKESLARNGRSVKVYLFQTNESAPDTSLLLPITTYTGKKGNRRRWDLYREKSILSQLALQKVQKDVNEGVTYVVGKMTSIFFLDPMPQHMRSYSSLSKTLKEDASNIAGVIAALEDDERDRIEKKVAEFVRPLPERDIKQVWTETVGMFNKDAMLYCKEEWTNDNEMTLDARGMSDGTLRFIAIVAAILTIPRGTLLMVEEVDNGLHPSRTKELVHALSSLGEECGLDVLCTTHNPVLIDELGDDMFQNICFVKRNAETGCSDIHLLEDKTELARLMAAGSVGDMMIRDQI